MRKDSFAASLYRREIQDPGVRSKSYRKLYTHRQLIDRLDIVNELDGHSGCVNALSWSKSGSLLASGSDDQHLNIHTYQPENTTNQFQLSATVATGHTQNIFSVKFMPHSNDRTVITAAGDAQVRIFDLEYAGQRSTASAASSLASEGRRRGRANVYNGVKYLSDGDTNARVYKSHGDRVKRIVTESSPHLFLTCSEDGEVRQWDLRQPSSAYPEPRSSRFAADGSLPPPLISYKRYALDLNTISCSASQPHYILLGGAHLHAFLHDRRFTGRDRLAEMGKPLSPINSLTPDEQELMSQATRCVKKFSPQGQKKMRRSDNGHITACKISDARPDEAVVSWSGDHIYSFDLHRDPSDNDQAETISPLRSSKAKESRDRKRKRKMNGSELSLGQYARESSRQRTEDRNEQDTTLRIRYQNGQSEDVTLPAQNRPLTEQQQSARRIATSTVKIRSSLFRPESGHREPSTAQFTSSLGHAASIITDIDESIRTWGYPMSPDAEDVYIQTTLRRGRERTRRFVQAAGTLARVLGGKLQTASGSSSMIDQFLTVETRSTELELPSEEQFCFDFLKAILRWLDSGIGYLIEGFTKPNDVTTGSKLALRLPLGEDDQTENAIDEILIPYFFRLASDRPLIDVDANRFETAESRQLFATEKEAVRAFAAAVKIPFADLGGSTKEDESQDRRTAIKYWAGKIGLGLLLNASTVLNFTTVDRCFGGLGQPLRTMAAEEAHLNLLFDSDREEHSLQALELVDENGIVVDGATAGNIASAANDAPRRSGSASGDSDMEGDNESTSLLTAPSRPRQATVEAEDEQDDDEGGDDDNGEDDMDVDSDTDDEGNDSDSSSEADEEDGVPNLGVPRYIYRPAFERRRMRPKVEADVTCGKPTRRYRGHCNVRTVKDVNYFGPDDEYVVSGSDDGNFFIWDRKTTELVNLLEGDGEVVNVIQGHPYETMLAVSGIDHTIKIFSPDARAREIARLGRGIFAHDASTFSSLSWPMRLGRRRPRRSNNEPSEPAVSAAEEAKIEDDEEYVAPNGLTSRKRMHDCYQIMQQNNVEREGGNDEDTIISLPHAQLLQLLFGQMGNVGFMPGFE